MRLERLEAGRGSPGQLRELVERVRALAPAAAGVAPAVSDIVEQVRTGGDGAVLELTRRWDTGGAAPRGVRVPGDEIEAAFHAQDPSLIAALELARDNVAAVARAWLEDDRDVDLPQGQRVRLRTVPVTSAAVYVPGGQAPYPSTAVMGVVTAGEAGVDRVCLCSPPGPAGDPHPAVLAAARLCGAGEVYAMGGAQAVAALAHGTETVRPVDVVVGPGNLYVQEAKRQLSGTIGIDAFAGPSDLLVLLSAGADPALAALDLLAQAEHGPATIVAAVSAERALLDEIAGRVDALASGRPTVDPAACVLVDAADLETARALTEELAPEHLQLVGQEAEALAPSIRRAGCLFVGASAGTAFGDYVAGSNHVLPTAGTARFASALSPADFRRRMTEVHLGPAAEELARAGAAIARAEGFVVHAESMEARIGDNGRDG